MMRMYRPVAGGGPVRSAVVVSTLAALVMDSRSWSRKTKKNQMRQAVGFQMRCGDRNALMLLYNNVAGLRQFRGTDIQSLGETG
jgi:hypothetical protein